MLYKNRKKINNTPIALIITSIIILIPKILQILFNTIKIDTSIIPYFNTIYNSDIYSINFIRYSKTLFTIGIIFLIISIIIKIFEKSKSAITI